MIPTTPLKMPKLEFNIRSFHPEKDFGWSGLMFEGDNRGFSNKPSGTVAIKSRIWHQFLLDSGKNALIFNKTHSDKSKAPWSDKYKDYKGELAPKGLTMPLIVNRKANTDHFKLQGSYGGVNHAMPGSSAMQKSLGMSYVPTLDVNYKLQMDVDKVNKHVDIVLEVNGDGFPNCEAFVVDENGKSVFLGIHVRKGSAPTTLVLNANMRMIVCAIRLPLDNSGCFKGTVGDEWARVKNKSSRIEYKNIDEWNMQFSRSNPNRNHCMLLEKWSLDGCF